MSGPPGAGSEGDGIRDLGPGQQLHDWVAKYGWIAAGIVVVIISAVQLFGPLPSGRPTMLLMAIGLAMSVWGVSVWYSQRILDAAHRYRWLLLAGFVALAGGLK